ncbi:autotransporter assembly complex family protein [Alkalimonas delamerensis]|uniref:Translocation and assembly module subunit TamA n=1 Tax=Alkalimonas delamerensis TaxID=265981 RepID=A0ABT9GN95_9GAMM|nr:autotransporter assembly complex family protein [Alkalimonas delamerensis]MDP4528417.1 autotransporter assembly complex family protein [Alkalimonas delamerensis]
MHWARQIGFMMVLWLLVPSPVTAEQTRLQIQGVSGAARDNVELYLANFANGHVSTSLRFQARIELEARTALRALGYYHPEFHFQIERSARGSVLIMQIEPGAQTHYQQVDVQITGDAATDLDFLRLKARLAPQPGDPVHHGRYEQLKSSLDNLALRKGYFQADFTQNRLAVSEALKEARLTLHFDSGPRYHFGDVRFSGSQIQEQRLYSLIPFQSGEPYLASLLGEFNQALANTNWFGSILIEPDNESLEDRSQMVPLHVQLEPRARNSVELGVGYTEVQGGRLKVNWNRPWLNDRGHSLNNRLALSSIEQSLESSYRLPLRNVAQDFYQFQTGVKNFENRDGKGQDYTLAAERHWLLTNQWYRTASVRWLYSEFIQAEKEDRSNLWMPGISFTRSRSQGGMMPSRGDRLLFSAEVSDRAWGSDNRFIRLRSRANYITSFGSDHRVVTRLDAGAILLEEATELPPSLRFFAGGDNSIRGYGYERVAPRDDAGLLLGGRYMVTGSAEYQYRLTGNWWLASFVDYGSSWSRDPDWKRGVGLGVRWASPIGPVRLDFAWGLDHDEGKPRQFQLHFSLGPEL